VQGLVADAGGAVRVFEAGDAALLAGEAVADRRAALQVCRAAGVAGVGRVDTPERLLALAAVGRRNASACQTGE